MAATWIEQNHKEISFGDAVTLARLVLEQDGGPVPIRGKRAFTDGPTAKRLARLELGELREDWGSDAGALARTVWVLSASELGQQMVREALVDR